VQQRLTNFFQVKPAAAAPAKPAAKTAAKPVGGIKRASSSDVGKADVKKVKKE